MGAAHRQSDNVGKMNKENKVQEPIAIGCDATMML